MRLKFLIPVHQVFRAPRRGRHRIVGRQCRGQLLQCSRRDHKRPLRSQGHSPARPWRSFEAVEYDTLEWVDWFNNRRLLELIGNIPPAEAEANFYAALETKNMAA